MRIRTWLITASCLATIVVSFTAVNKNSAVNELETNSIPLLKRISLTNEMSNLPALEPVDSMVNRVMRNLRLTGATVAVVKNEKLVYAKGFGYADKENKIAVEPYHLFRIGSVSKLVTAIAVLKLVNDGKITLDDYVFGEKGHGSSIKQPLR